MRYQKRGLRNNVIAKLILRYAKLYITKICISKKYRERKRFVSFFFPSSERAIPREFRKVQNFEFVDAESRRNAKSTSKSTGRLIVEITFDGIATSYVRTRAHTRTADTYLRTGNVSLQSARTSRGALCVTSDSSVQYVTYVIFVDSNCDELQLESALIESIS